MLILLDPEADQEASEMLTDNAQNLMQAVSEVLYATEAATIRVPEAEREQLGLQWVKRNWEPSEVTIPWFQIVFNLIINSLVRCNAASFRLHFIFQLNYFYLQWVISVRPIVWLCHVNFSIVSANFWPRGTWLVEQTWLAWASVGLNCLPLGTILILVGSNVSFLIYTSPVCSGPALYVTGFDAVAIGPAVSTYHTRGIGTGYARASKKGPCTSHKFNSLHPPSIRSSIRFNLTFDLYTGTRGRSWTCSI